MMTRAAILEINDHLQRSIAPIAIRFKRLLNLRKRKSMRDEPRGIDVPAPDGPLRDLHERPQDLGHPRVNREGLAHDWVHRGPDIPGGERHRNGSRAPGQSPKPASLLWPRRARHARLNCWSWSPTASMTR